MGRPEGLLPRPGGGDPELPEGRGAESLPSRPAGDGDGLPADRRRQATRGWPRRPAGRPRLSPHRRRGIAWRRRRRRGGNAWRRRPARVPIPSPSRPRRSSEAVVVAGGSGGSGRARYLVFISRGRAEAGIGRGCSPATAQILAQIKHSQIGEFQRFPPKTPSSPPRFFDIGIEYP